MFCIDVAALDWRRDIHGKADSMNEEFVVYRVLHIVFGSFWVGSALFLTIILEPRLRAMGPHFHGPVMGAVTKVQARRS